MIPSETCLKRSKCFKVVKEVKQIKAKPGNGVKPVWTECKALNCGDRKDEKTDCKGLKVPRYQNVEKTQPCKTLQVTLSE